MLVLVCPSAVAFWSKTGTTRSRPCAICLAREAACLPFGVVRELRREVGPTALAALLLFMGLGIMDMRVAGRVFLQEKTLLQKVEIAIVIGGSGRRGGGLPRDEPVSKGSLVTPKMLTTRPITAAPTTA